MGWGVSSTPRPPLPPGKTRYPLYRRLGGPRAGLDRPSKSRYHRNSIPDRPARSQSLYRMSYPAPAALDKNGILMALFSLACLFLYFFFSSHMPEATVFSFMSSSAPAVCIPWKKGRRTTHIHIYIAAGS